MNTKKKYAIGATIATIVIVATTLYFIQPPSVPPAVYDPIRDNNMSSIALGAPYEGSYLATAGFNNTNMSVGNPGGGLENIPLGLTLQNRLSDQDMRVYFHLSHGSDTYCEPAFFAKTCSADYGSLHSALQNRSPLTITVLTHCGESYFLKI